MSRLLHAINLVNHEAKPYQALGTLKWTGTADSITKQQQDYLLLVATMIRATAGMLAVLEHTQDANLLAILAKHTHERRAELQYNLLMGRNTSE